MAHKIRRRPSVRPLVEQQIRCTGVKTYDRRLLAADRLVQY